MEVVEWFFVGFVIGVFLVAGVLSLRDVDGGCILSGLGMTLVLAILLAVWYGQ